MGFHDWIGDSYAILFSHPKDFTPVCTTEFGAVAQLAPEFAKRKTKVMGVSVDSVATTEMEARHRGLRGRARRFPDHRRHLAGRWPRPMTCCPPITICPEGRTPAHSATVRTVYIIGPDKKVRLTMTYPMSVGRNFAEILRALDAVQDDRRRAAGHARQLGAGAGRDRGR
jgi:thioredoxin-dependent peroxiredoxin